jgi:hypothetical protein
MGNSARSLSQHWKTKLSRGRVGPVVSQRHYLPVLLCPDTQGDNWTDTRKPIGVCF